MAATVTFVVPARNAAGTLAETLASISGQSRGDWQAIVVVDSSTDATLAVAQAACADRRFAVVETAAGSAAAARNRGAALAKTDWLVFLDADDLIDGAYLAAMLGAAEREPSATMVHCAGRKMAPDGRRGGVEYPPSTDHLSHLQFRNIFYTHGLLLRRQAVLAQQGFRTSLRVCEDWDLWVRLIAAGARLVEVDRPLATYRMVPGSLAKHPQAVVDCSVQVIRRAVAARHGIACNSRSRRLAVQATVQASACGLAFWAMGLSLAQGRVDTGLARRLAGASGLPADQLAIFFIDGAVRGLCCLWEDWPQLFEAKGAAIAAAAGHLAETYPGASDWPRFHDSLRRHGP